MKRFAPKKKKLWLYLAALVVLASALCLHFLRDPFTRRQRALAEGLPTETALYILDSGKPGNTLLLLAGTHGNEDAGYVAARQLKDTLRPEAGKVLLIPEANRRAIEAYARTAADGVDMNRTYPGDKTGGDVARLCAMIMELIEKERPAAVVDMHEGRNFYGVDGSIGNSIVANLKPENFLVLPDILEYVNSRNGGLPDFTYDTNAPEGSLNCEAFRRLGVDAFTIETTQKLDLDVRVRQQITFVEGLLTLYEIPYHITKGE